MSSNLKKTLLIALSVFAVMIVGIGVVYLVRKPTVIAPSPKPVASAQKAPILQVDPVNVCSTTFVVACASGSPSPSPSGSVTPSPSSSVSPSPSFSPSISPSPSSVLGAQLDCVVKRIYEDDSRNRAGFYYFENEIVDTNLLQDGQTVVYNVVMRNTGGAAVSDTTVTDKLSSNLTYLDGDSGCSYDSATRTVSCTVGSLAANSEAQRSFRARITVAGTTSIANTAEVSSTNGQRDSCSIQVDATGKVVVPSPTAPAELPEAGVMEITTGTLGAGLLLLILGGLGLLLL